MKLEIKCCRARAAAEESEMERHLFSLFRIKLRERLLDPKNGNNENNGKLYAPSQNIALVECRPDDNNNYSRIREKSER